MSLPVHSLIHAAQTVQLDGVTLLPEQQLEIRALVRLEGLYDAGCGDGAVYRGVIDRLREARAIVARRRAEAVRAPAPGGLKQP